MSKLFLLKYLILLLVSHVDSFDRKVKISDPFLDVILMLDQSASMNSTHYKEAHTDMKNWIESYYDREGTMTSSHFAVIYCCQLPKFGGIKHNLNGGDFNIAVPKLLTAAQYNADCDDNWNGCLDEAITSVFPVSAGGRENSTKIALYITDCDFHMTHTGGLDAYNATAHRFASEINKDNKGKLFFLCTAMDKQGGGYEWDLDSEDGKDRKNIMAMLSINKQSADAIILHYPNFKNFTEAIKAIVPLREVDVFECKMKNECSNACTWKKPHDPTSCIKLCNETISVIPFPPGVAKSCKPGIHEEPCDSCPKLAIQTQKPSATIYIIIGVIGGLVLLLVIAGIIACRVKARQKKVVPPERCLDVKVDDKKQCIAADLTITMPMKNDEASILKLAVPKGSVSKMSPTSKGTSGQSSKMTKSVKCKRKSAKSYKPEPSEKSKMTKSVKCKGKSVKSSKP